jgi:D-sedoheptulose 7-phosphate isomerase
MNKTLSIYSDLFYKSISNTVFTSLENKVLNQNDAIAKIFNILSSVKQSSNRVYIIGNGGSSAIASHTSIDFINVAKIKTHTLHEASTLTCFSNDYGYDNVFSRQIDNLFTPEDVLISISSSGNSKNIINAVEVAKNIGGTVITFSGFNKNNSIRKIGSINCWVDSDNYGIVEISHQFVLHFISDMFAINNEK